VKAVALVLISSTREVVPGPKGTPVPKSNPTVSPERFGRFTLVGGTAPVKLSRFVVGLNPTSVKKPAKFAAVIRWMVSGPVLENWYRKSKVPPGVWNTAD